MSNEIVELVDIATGEVGYHEGRSNGHWNNDQKYSDETPGLEWSDYQAWCATFISWCAMKAKVADLFPRTASCATGVAWFRNKGRFSAYPAVGAQIFYGSGGGTHTELCIGYDADNVYSIGGNTNLDGSPEGDGVYRKTHARRSDYVYGYGYPAFPGGSVSADPDAAKYGYRVKATATVADVADPKPDAPKPTTPAKPKYEPFPGASWFKKNPKSPLVTAMGKRLVAVGCSAYKDGPGPQWTEADRKSYAKWQRKNGYTGADADGWPGKSTWDKLRVPKV
ncbi:endolysin [Streptomyces phage Heather]|uniref:Endolysin n=1 Tax=Streptomyces phage Heather TaxID=2562343 RepID=A0A4D6E3Z5_9CAUD|nr:endolysin [Streptomyces phage Heather]